VVTANGKPICNSIAQYGGKDVETKMEDGKTWASISAMTTCDEVRINKGDVLTIVANYDLAKHPA